MNEQNFSITPAFYSDKDIARRLNLSPSWVRGERFKRRHGQPHTLTLDPCLIGSAVRYVACEVEAWITSITLGSA